MDVSVMLTTDNASKTTDNQHPFNFALRVRLGHHSALVLGGNRAMVSQQHRTNVIHTRKGISMQDFVVEDRGFA